jgi:hypothetical protein
MRADQLQRLRELSEGLADAFLLEADPAEWSGNGKPPAELTKQERGDRYWCKKNAMATGGVLRYTLDLLKHQETGAQFGSPAEEAAREVDLDRKIADAEKRAEAAVARVMRMAQGKQSSKP